MSVAADRDYPATLVVGGHRHPAADPLCAQCVLGYPRGCACGGWVHGGEVRGRPAFACSRCGPDARPLDPLILGGAGGATHTPGRADCPACPPGRIAACVCGGLIHESTDGTRRCDRCGDRHEEPDV